MTDHDGHNCEALIEAQLCQTCGHHIGSAHNGTPAAELPNSCSNCDDCTAEGRAVLLITPDGRHVDMLPAEPAPLLPCGCTNVTKCRAHNYPVMYCELRCGRRAVPGTRRCTTHTEPLLIDAERLRLTFGVLAQAVDQIARSLRASADAMAATVAQINEVADGE